MRLPGTTIDPGYTNTNTAGTAAANNEVIVANTEQRIAILDMTGLTNDGKALVCRNAGFTEAELVAAFNDGDVPEAVLLLFGVAIPGGASVSYDYQVLNPVLTLIAGGGTAAQRRVGGVFTPRFKVPNGKAWRATCSNLYPVDSADATADTVPFTRADVRPVPHSSTEGTDGSVTIDLEVLFTQELVIAAAYAEVPAGTYGTIVHIEVYDPDNLD